MYNMKIIVSVKSVGVEEGHQTLCEVLQVLYLLLSHSASLLILVEIQGGDVNCFVELTCAPIFHTSGSKGTRRISTSGM
jgi:hypothetical protein